MKSSFYGIVLIFFAPCAAMHQPETVQEKMYTIQDSNENLVQLPEFIIKKIGVLNNYEIYEDDAIYDFSFKDSGLNISGEQLKTLEFCLQNPKKIKEFNANTLNEIFEVADCLGVEHSFLRRLTRYAQKHFPEYKHHELIQTNHYRNSITYLWTQSFFAYNNEQNFLIKKQNVYQEDVYCLDLAYKMLDTLHGIEKVKPLLSGKKITLVRLNNNCLKEIDLKQLFTLFPRIKKLKLHNNELVSIHLPSNMPSKTKINFDNNPLEHISGALTEESVLSIKGITITDELLECLDSCIKPSWYAQHRYQIKSICSLQTLKEFGKMSVVGGVSITLLTFRVFSDNQSIGEFIQHPLAQVVIGIYFTAFGLLGAGGYNRDIGFSKHKIIDGFKPARIIKE